MKRLLMLMAMAIPCLLLAFRAEPSGFRGVAWGTALAGRKDFIPIPPDKSDPGWEVVEQIGKENRVALYTRSRDPLTVGDVAVDSIRYATLLGRLADVDMAFRGRAAFDALRTHVGITFEPMHCVGRPCDDLRWELKGQITDIFLYYDPAKDKGNLSFSSIEVHREYNDWLQKRAASENGF